MHLRRSCGRSWQTVPWRRLSFLMVVLSLTILLFSVTNLKLSSSSGLVANDLVAVEDFRSHEENDVLLVRAVGMIPVILDRQARSFDYSDLVSVKEFRDHKQKQFLIRSFGMIPVKPPSLQKPKTPCNGSLSRSDNGKVLLNCSTNDVIKDNQTFHSFGKISGNFFKDLGNDMFKFASLYAIAKANGLTPFILTRNILNALFDLGDDLMVLESKPTGHIGRLYEEAKAGGYDAKMTKPKTDRAVILDGYLQSWKYFSNYSEQIKRCFTFKDNIALKAKAVLNKIRASVSAQTPRRTGNLTLVGVHVFRGNVENLKLSGYNVPEEGYYRQAFEYYNKKFGHLGPVLFLVSARDINWALEAFRNVSNAVFLQPTKHASYTMSILSQCDHTVMSIGSFGWWAGWLAGGEVVYYGKLIARPDSKVGKEFVMEDYYPKNWIPFS